MKLRIQKNDFTQALQSVQKVAANKSNNLSSENGLLIKALNNVIEIQANDYDMGIKTIVPGIIEEAGEVFLWDPHLSELTRRINSDEIILTKNESNSQMTIHGGKLTYRYVTMNTEDFNEVEVVEQGYAQFEIDSVTLKELIDNTSYACATDTSRPVFTGTFMDVSEKSLSMVATDTHRLALKSTVLEQSVTDDIQAIIPSRLLTEVSRQLPTDVPVVVKVTAVRNYLAIQFGNVYMRTRLIEGIFPDYRRVIPTEFQNIITVNRGEFTEAVERISIVAKDAQYNVINFEIKNNQIKMTSQDPDHGTVEDSVECNMSGEPIAISFNGRFILDLLRHCHKDEIFLNAEKTVPCWYKIKTREIAFLSLHRCVQDRKI